MSDVMHVVDLAMFLTSANQEEIKGILVLKKEMLYATIVTNLVTLQDFAKERM